QLHPSDPKKPTDPTVRDVGATVEQLWLEILGSPPCNDGDFFALGGDSLAAVQLLNRIEQLFGVRIPADTFFQRPQVSTLTSALSEGLVRPHAATPDSVQAAQEREVIDV